MNHLWLIPAAIVFASLMYGVGKLLGYYIEKPEHVGRHQRPTRAQRERAADDAYLRQLEEVRAEQHMEAGPVTASGMALPGPLMPLPPEPYWPVEQHTAEHETLCQDAGPHDFDPCPRCGYGCHPGACVPEDPHDVASGEQEADALVGPPQPGDPYLEHLASRQYADSTGTFAAIAGGE